MKKGNIADVQKIFLKSQSEIILTLKGVVYLDEKKIFEDISYVYLVGTNLYLHDFKKGITKYNLDNNKSEVWLKTHPFVNTKYAFYIISSDSEKDKITRKRRSRLNFYSLSSNELQYSTKDKYSFFQSLWLGEDIVYTSSYEDIVIKNLHLPTETTLWQFDSSELGVEKVGKIMGVFGEVLVVGIRIGLNELGLMALSISKGELVWQEMFSHSDLALNVSHFTKDNTLISLGRFGIWEFDLAEKKVIRNKDISEKLVHNDKPFKISSATLEEGKFYFVAHYVGQSMSSALLGIFNTETEELEWIHDFEGEVHLGGNARPKVCGNKIYTLDTNNTLHIFERESSKP